MQITQTRIQCFWTHILEERLNPFVILWPLCEQQDWVVPPDRHNSDLHPSPPPPGALSLGAPKDATKTAAKKKKSAEIINV